MTMSCMKRFCGCYTTRTGTLFSGYYTMGLGGAFIIMLLIRYVGKDFPQQTKEHIFVTYSSLFMYSFLICVSLVLLSGVFLDKKFCLVPWLMFMLILEVFDIGTTILTVLRHMESGKDWTPDGWAIFLTIFYVVRTLLSVYCIVCVWSQYCELKAGRGTYLYHQKRRRHNRNMVAQVHPINQPESSQHTRLSTVSAYCEASRVSYNKNGEVVLNPPPYLLDPPTYSQINLEKCVSDDNTAEQTDIGPLVTSCNSIPNAASAVMSSTPSNLMSHASGSLMSSPLTINGPAMYQTFNTMNLYGNQNQETNHHDNPRCNLW